MRVAPASRRAASPAWCGALLLAACTALAIRPAPLRGQELERHVLSGGDVAIYNLAGEVRIEPGSGPGVVVELTRGGEDAQELRILTGPIEGQQTLRVYYPADRVVYRRTGRGTRTSLRVREDGTFYGGGGDGWFDRGDRVTIAGSGGGLEAYADVRIEVPSGTRLSVYLGVGAASVSNVDGDLLVDVGAAAVDAAGTRGRLSIDTGSGRIAVRDAQGDVELDTGSGNIEVFDVRGPRLLVDTGSGRVEGGELAAEDIEVDTGSGSISLDRVSARRIRLDTGSGSVELGLLADVDELDIDTGSGGVSLMVPVSLDAEVELDTGSGGIDVEALSLRVIEWERDRLVARAGNGRGSVRIDTGSGRIQLRGVATGT